MTVEIFGIKETLELVIIFKLSIAAFIGFIIGLERELRRKSVGIKTCIVISVVSCLLTVVSIEASQIYSEAYTRPMDPLRLAAQIVSGVGFLGAGVILRRSNDAVSGLTTAAIVWGVSGLGITIGAGFIIEAVVSSLFILLGVELLPFLIQHLTPFKVGDRKLIMKLTVNSGTDVSPILKKIKRQKIKISDVDIEDERDGQTVVIITGYINSKRYATDVYEFLKEIDEIKKIKVR